MEIHTDIKDFELDAYTIAMSQEAHIYHKLMYYCVLYFIFEKDSN